MATQTLDLTVGVRNFGPIAQGEISLKPLTILVGPNNSGKSYAAMLLHSIFGAGSSDTWLPRVAADICGVAGLGPSSVLPFLTHELGRIPRPKAGQTIAVEPEITAGLVRELLKDIWGRALSQQLKRCMQCPVEDLVSIGKESSEIGIGSALYRAEIRQESGGRSEVSVVHTNGVRLRIEATGPEEAPDESHSHGDLHLRVPASWLSESPTSKSFIGRLWGGLYNAVLEWTHRPCYYLPAARSAILQGHRALAASIIRQAPLVALGQSQAPGLSGVVADFLSTLLNLPVEKGELYDLGQDMEREVTNGEIKMVAPRAEVPREIKYRFRNTDIPLHRASSTVSELAPLVLYLKYVVSPGSVLIIEEPEAHLHPANQRIIAKYLAQLVRRGVHVLITTHSDWLVEQLSSIVKLASMRPQVRAKKFPGLKDAFLAPEDVGAYVFSYDGKSRGHRIEGIKVDEDGIPEDEFLRIHEELYEESIAIEKARERR